MAGSASAGSQLYARLAQLLAPVDSLANSSFLVILEPGGKGLASMEATDSPVGQEAFADLANAVPAAAASFLDSGSYYDDVWDLVINGALPSGPIDDPIRVTVSRVVNEGRADFEMMARVRSDVPEDVYRPVRATPKDWLSPDGWSRVSFKIGGTESPPAPDPPPTVFVPEVIPELEWIEIAPLPDELPIVDRVVVDREPPVVDPPPIVVDREPPFVEPFPVEPSVVEPEIVGPVVIDPEPPLIEPQVLKALEAVRADQPVELSEFGEGLRFKDVFIAGRLVDEKAVVTPTSPPTSGFELSFEYRVVGLQRPWLKSQLLHLSGWSIPGLGAGGISNGHLSGNPGLMPVMTTRMLVVRNLVVKANWSEADRAKAEGTATIAFGPFTVTGDASFDGTQMSRPAPQVVAWLATVVPACPADPPG